jgi:pilus assembly protein CpaE
MMLRNLAILAFVEVPGIAVAAKSAAGDPRLAKSKFEVHAGGIAQATAWLAANRSPDVLIVNDATEGELAARLESLAEVVEPSCKVIIVGRRDSIALYRELTARGLSDYLGGDLSAKDLVDAIVRLFSTEDNLPKGKLVVVTAASGGAGGTTVSAVIADELNRRMGDAILLDLDLHMGTAALALGVEVRDAVADAAVNAGLDVAMLERFVVRQRGARVLSTPGSLGNGRRQHGTPGRDRAVPDQGRGRRPAERLG